MPISNLILFFILLCARNCEISLLSPDKISPWKLMKSNVRGIWMM
jgi:hypothetical protein